MGGRRLTCRGLVAAGGWRRRSAAGGRDGTGQARGGEAGSARGRSLAASRPGHPHRPASRPLLSGPLFLPSHQARSRTPLPRTPTPAPCAQRAHPFSCRSRTPTRATAMQSPSPMRPQRPRSHCPRRLITGHLQRPTPPGVSVSAHPCAIAPFTHSLVRGQVGASGEPAPAADSPEVSLCLPTPLSWLTSAFGCLPFCPPLPRPPLRGHSQFPTIPKAPSLG